MLHVPHDSTFIPPEVRDQFLLTDEALDDELRRMTDHFTQALFTARVSAAVVVRAPVSRLVVDVERFPNDEDEPMAARGMGAVYRATSGLTPLRRDLSPEERATLMRTWYAPHHRRLERAVAESLLRHGRCLVIDCHSFPSEALPYEQAHRSVARPDICIGTDAFHTGEDIARAFTDAFRRTGWTVAVDQPFAGALVPASRYRRDPRVGAVMIEVNRRLYLDESEATRRADFDAVAARVGACCVAAVEAIETGHGPGESA